MHRSSAPVFHGVGVTMRSKVSLYNDLPPETRASIQSAISTMARNIATKLSRQETMPAAEALYEGLMDAVLMGYEAGIGDRADAAADAAAIRRLGDLLRGAR